MTTRTSLPASWQDPNALFWDCHLEEVASDIVTHLMEVDWLPEAAKPILRQAHLSISLYAEHIRREAKRDQNRRLGDVSTSLKTTIQRVNNMYTEKTRAQKLDRLMAKRNAKLKKERDEAAALQLAADTDVRLMVHQLNEQQSTLDVAEARVVQEIGEKELSIVQEMFSSALQAGTNARLKLTKAHTEIKRRNKNNGVVKILQRPNTRGSGDRRPHRRSPGQLDPLPTDTSSTVRPSTAPTTQKRGKRALKDGSGTRSRDKSRGSLAAPVDVKQLYGAVAETMKELDKYHGELLRVSRKYDYERKRKSMKSGEWLRAKSQKRLQKKAKQRKREQKKVFSDDIEKMIEANMRGVRMKFH